MNGIKARGNCRARSGSTSIGPLIVVAAVLAGTAIAVVVAVRAAGQGSAKSVAGGLVTGEPTAENPLRSPADSHSGSSVEPQPSLPDVHAQPATPPGATQASVTAQPSDGALPSVSNASPSLPPAAAAGEHPLDPAIALADKLLENLRKHVKDYSAVIVSQERVGGKLSEQEFMAVKIRQDPFSAYLDFLKPDDVRGREVLYVAGANDGNLLVRESSGWQHSLGMLSLKPTGLIAMQGNRYPITDLGLMHLTDRLLEIARQDRRYGEVDVHFFKDCKVNGRVCTMIEVVHPTERRNFLFHKAQIYIDDELNVPIRYAAYMWPKEPGAEAPLDEVYTYLNLKLNVGLTDADFDPHSSNYHFMDK
jgi:hypothetical protein